jgi:hypothetical protein
LPIVILVDFSKSRRSSSVHGMHMPTHGFSGAVHSCYSQRSRRARAIAICSLPSLLDRRKLDVFHFLVMKNDLEELLELL